MLTIRDAAPESYQLVPESLETFQPSYASSKAKNENDPSEIRFPTLRSGAFLNQKFNKQMNVMNNRRLLIAAIFHFAHPVEKDS